MKRVRNQLFLVYLEMSEQVHPGGRHDELNLFLLYEPGSIQRNRGYARLGQGTAG